MICFVCATPYHIILSMMIKEKNFPDEPSSLLVYNHFGNSKVICEKLRSDNIFQTVIYLDENNSSFFNRLKRGIRSFRPGYLIREFAKKSCNREIIIFALDYLNISYVIKVYHKRHLQCKFSYGEDGIGTYMDPGTYVPNKTANFLLLLSGRKKWLEKITGLYVLEPLLLQCNYEKEISIIAQSSQNAVLEYCKMALWPQSRVLNLKQVVYLQEPFQILELPCGAQIENEIINLMKQTYTEERFSIKLHPRMDGDKYEGGNVIKTTTPFECLLSDLDLNHMILVSIVCTAAITSGLLYRENPYVVFTYKLFPDLRRRFDETMTNLIECLRAVPCYEQKIFVPKDMEELETILLILKKIIEE